MLPSLVMLLTLIYCTSGENPAMQVILTNKGLQYGKHVTAGWIQETLEHATLPDISGKINFAFLVNIHYTFSGVTIRKCDFPEPSVEFYQDTSGFKMSITGLNVAFTGGWEAHCWFIHRGGSFDMALFGVDLVSIVQLGRDTDGHLSLTSVNCTAETGNVDLHFYGERSWVLRHLESRIKDRIKDQLPTMICSALEEVIANLENYLKDMKVNFPLDEDVTLDLPLTGLPLVEMTNLQLGLKGEIYSIKSPKEPPFQAQPFTVPQQPGYMLSIGLSDFTANSASFSYFSSDLLQAFINDSMIPPFFPVRLNTTSMGPFIPQLPEMFPDLMMLLQIYATDIPMFSFHSGAVMLSMQGAVKAFAIQHTRLAPLFKLHVNSNFSGKAWVADGRLKGSVTMQNFTLSLRASEIGPFKIDGLKNLALALMQIVVLPQLNDKLATGFALPRTLHAQLVNSVLTVEEGFVAFSSDAELMTSDTIFS
ncbi:bactericidal permeability-increasing protein [Corythoichthys intestinalis]|uniref:bactericidal permeability-increasing protein n=1 Tax=Corythoichthys intestinalis TaxID=161448 RepID=UPI0025A5AA5E|nr:bactericidal permeability-increasing protein [Corythoichthys intestinalis]XP_061802953.1 bactericidal permeability-increasing protein-like [Nerophis lumbriciformis]